MATREELEAEATRLFTGIGLDDRTCQEILRNAKLRQRLVDAIREAGAEGGCPRERGVLIHAATTRYPAAAAPEHRAALLGLIGAGKVRTSDQLDGALEHLKALGPVGEGDAPLDAAALEAAAGVGAEVTPEQLAAACAEVVAEATPRLLEARYRLNVASLLPGVRARLRWADARAARAELEARVAALLGPKTEADLAPPADGPRKKAPKKPPPPPAEASASGGAGAGAGGAAPAPEERDPWAFLPRPEDNTGVHTEVTFSDGRPPMRVANTRAQLAAHLAATGGAVVTRFPPEPNGYLHIGHAKAMHVDFGMAAARRGACVLRFDDTNPEAEKQEYIDHITDIVSWLGWAPSRVTHSADYFAELYAIAERLIAAGHAYVCHQSADEIRASREAREGSPWRDRPPAESAALFADMRRGLVNEGAATLRLRQDPRNDNYNMFDLVAYRVKFVAHPRAGDAWCVYPSYDFTHCLVDSLEHVTHSMCTLEFETRRASYFWLLEVAGMYKPVVWEYSRLNITHTVLSKRKLARLVAGGHVSGWDDPRLLTLAGLRRRGVPPEAVNAFCRSLGVTRAESEVHPHLLEHHVRADADARCPRRLAVLRPLRLVLTNLPADHFEEVAARAWPPGRGDDATYAAPLTRVVYIEADDFRVADEPKYYGLAPGKTAMLRYACAVECTGFSTDPATGAVTEVRAEVRRDVAKPPKGVLHWVGQPAPGVPPPAFEARLYGPLFTAPDAAARDDWLELLNPDSLTVVRGAVATPALAAARPGDRFQLERLGYFAVDAADSAPGALVLNRVVTLKESAERKVVAAKGGGGK